MSICKLTITLNSMYKILKVHETIKIIIINLTFRFTFTFCHCFSITVQWTSFEIAHIISFCHSWSVGELHYGHIEIINETITSVYIYNETLLYIMQPNYQQSKIVASFNFILIDWLILFGSVLFSFFVLTSVLIKKPVACLTLCINVI